MQVFGASSTRAKSLLDSDRIKYQQALALQRLSREPGAVLVELRYHMAWNVRYREPLFSHPGDMLDVVTRALSRPAMKSGDFAALLWLAPDHLHVYVESNGEYSVERIVKELKRLLATALRKSETALNAKKAIMDRIWDEAYFAETIS